jgi:hypothetical protein
MKKLFMLLILTLGVHNASLAGGGNYFNNSTIGSVGGGPTTGGGTTTDSFRYEAKLEYYSISAGQNVFEYINTATLAECNQMFNSFFYNGIGAWVIFNCRVVL